MSEIHYSADEVSRLGNEIYHRDIRDKVMPELKGKFLILDILSGDYEVDTNDLNAQKILRKRQLGGIFFAIRIGYTSAYTLSGRMIEDAA